MTKPPKMPNITTLATAYSAASAPVARKPATMTRASLGRRETLASAATPAAHNTRAKTTSSAEVAVSARV